MREISVHVTRNYAYSIVIEKGLLHQLDRFYDFFSFYKRVVIVTDTHVGPIYFEGVKEAIVPMGCEVTRIDVDAGEKSKSLEQAHEIYEKLVEFHITRGDLLIALGGGVIGDLTGYCASTYLRGIDFVQIPTSLLSQVDSSVGGKVGVNLAQGKNLVGSFYQPKLVIIDPDTLDTLSQRNFADGMAEVIKYGCIYDKDLFEQLENMEKPKLMDSMVGIIERCCTIKKDIVEQDEMERQLRKILNFGHTLGHVVETYFHLEKYTHGEGVALGMYSFAKVGEEKNLTEKGTSHRVKSILIKYDLPVQIPEMDRGMVMDILGKDKKFEGSSISLVLLRKIGEAMVQKVEKEQLGQYIWN